MQTKQNKIVFACIFFTYYKGLRDNGEGQIRYMKYPAYKPSNCKLSKMWTCVPSTSGLTEVATCSSSPIADDPSALPSPPSSLYSSQ